MKILLVFLLLIMGQVSAEMLVNGQAVDTMPQYLDAVGIDPTDAVEPVLSPSSKLYFFKHAWEKFRLALPGDKVEYRMALADMRVNEMVMEAKHLNNTAHLGWLMGEYIHHVNVIDTGIAAWANIDDEWELALNKQARLQIANQNMILHHLYRHTTLEGKESVEIAFNKTVEQYQVKLGRAIIIQNRMESKKKGVAAVNEPNPILGRFEAARSEILGINKTE